MSKTCFPKECDRPMNNRGLTREERVLLNRLRLEYQRDQLPDPMQIRFDAAQLLGMVERLDEVIEKIMKERSA